MKLQKKYAWYAAAALLLLALAFGRSPAGTDASGTTEERRIAEVLGTMAGAGKVEVALFYAPQSAGMLGIESTTGRPTGAVVVAEGADDMAVRLSLARAVRTLLGLPETAVDVFVMEEGMK